MGLRFREFPSQLFQGRDAPPAHYMLKTKSFSQIAKSSISKYCSSEFKVGDYIWKLHIYPNGNTKEGGEGHISLNMEMMDFPYRPIGWAVNAVIKFFVFDQIEDKYYTIPDYKLVHFSALKKGWGIPRFIDLQVFNDSSNGYLVNNSCVFGAEIFIIAPLNKVDVLSLPDNGASLTRLHFWKIESFTKPAPNNCSYKESDTFTCGDFKWRTRVYPDGNAEGKGNSISLFLCLDLLTLPPDTEVSVTYTLRVTNDDKSTIFEEKGDNHCFSQAQPVDGFRKFMSLPKVRDESKGILIKDTLFVEAEVTILGVVTTQ